jgi:hypothetical protein
MDCLDAEHATNFAGRKLSGIVVFAKRQYARNMMMMKALTTARCATILHTISPVQPAVIHTARNVRERDISSAVSAATHTASFCAKIPSIARPAKVISAITARIPACVPDAMMNFVSIVERQLLARTKIATIPFVASSAKGLLDCCNLSKSVVGKRCRT